KLNLEKQTPSLPPKEEKHILLHGGNKETLDIPVSKFLYIESSGNYINVYVATEGGGTECHTLRCTIQQAEKNLAVFPEIIRCHRAYIVNMRQVAAVQSNHQGLLLKMKTPDMEIHVSRTYKKNFLTLRRMNEEKPA
ncbi:MAG: LytTR family transcriptional regulator, partial [Tannerella sp.]|nr:LytTR family transcriptional regulator [Tannerella sp.]